MTDVLTMIAFVVGWVVLQRFVFPKLGVPS